MDDARVAPPPPSAAPRASGWWIAVALLGFALLYAASLRDGHAWGGDNAMYVLHAKNLLAGNDYSDTGYLYNEASARFPPSYPPIFPLLLTPIVAAFGIAWLPMKLLTNAALIGALAFLASHERSRLPRAGLVLLLAWIALNPLIFDFRDSVLSEFPFLFFVCAALWLADRPRGSQPSDLATDLRHGCSLGLVIYLAYGTRSVGALLLPAVFLSEWVRHGRITRISGFAAIAFAPLALLQNAVLHSESGHFAYKLAQLSPTLPFENVFGRFPELWHAFWQSGEAVWPLGVGLACTAAVVALYGVVLRARDRRLDALDGFVLASLAFFLLIRLDDMSPSHRYWIPLFPLLVAEFVRGAVALGDWPFLALRPRLASGLAVCFVALSLLGLGLRHWELGRRAGPHDPIANGITQPDALELYAFVRRATAPDAPLLFFEPRVLTLYTGRPASELRVGGDRAEWMAWAEQIGARYWVRPGGLPETFRDALTPVFHNESFTVFRIDVYR